MDVIESESNHSHNHVIIPPNNKSNKLQLDVISETCLWDNQEFKYTVFVKNGIYYLDDHWSLIEIQNNKIVKKAYFTDADDVVPSFLEWLEHEDDCVKTHYMNPITDTEMHLCSVIPNNESAIRQIMSFISILHGAGFYVTEPHSFDQIRGKSNEPIIRLVEGEIRKYDK